MAVDFAGGVALVTGAGSGLGAALARRFAAAGMRVAVADLQLADAERVAQELRGQGADALALRVDIGDEASIGALARRLEQDLGPCQIVCANVGVQQFGRVEALPRSDWEWVFGVNVFGTIATARAFLPQLRRAAGTRRILITASTSALYPTPHMAAYTASKYAVLGFAETLRLELAEEGIGVSVILPGPMSTTHLQSSEKAKPHMDGAPVFTEESIRVVSAGTGGETIDPDHATRNVLRDLADDRPYIVTHDVHREHIDARLAAIRQAFERAGKS